MGNLSNISTGGGKKRRAVVQAAGTDTEDKTDTEEILINEGEKKRKKEEEGDDRDDDNGDNGDNGDDCTDGDNGDDDNENWEGEEIGDDDNESGEEEEISMMSDHYDYDRTRTEDTICPDCDEFSCVCPGRVIDAASTHDDDDIDSQWEHDEADPK